MASISSRWNNRQCNIQINGSFSHNAQLFHYHFRSHQSDYQQSHDIHQILTHLLARPTDSNLDRGGGELDRQLPRRARLPTHAAADGALGLHGLHRHPALLHCLRRRRRAGDQGQDDWRNHSSLQKVDQTALSSQSDERILKLLFSDWSRAFAPWVRF